MNKLDDVSADRLREALASVEDAKPAKRLVVALSYKDGESVETLSRRFGISRSTVYHWLDRFEERSLEDAINDDDRPGRPPKLDDSDVSALREELASPPTSLGYDADSWTPELVRDHIDAEYGVGYSLGHVRRLVRELGV